ncbi:MAG: bifunctional molybdenum cofactor biosynthesis protein MoaC/MoaB [Bacteroidota bacterium]|nr:bifunctional molybdenum cofactor biosynthesis protein MoaC/MoaB [Bacteroidota bacterium]
MRDITGKQITLRTAESTASIFCSKETIELIKSDKIPKGNIFEFARAAGFFAAKKTDQILPHCHPVNIDGLEINFEIKDNSVEIKCLAKSIGRTGIEMEALSAVSIAALTIYDMLKPVDTQLVISDIRLLEKKGGKSDQKYFNTPPKCAVLVCSDSTFEGKRDDHSGNTTIEMLKKHRIEDIEYKITNDDVHQIQSIIKEWVSQDIPYIFTTGGTGLSPRDNTVKAIKEIIEKEAPGIAEAMRAHGQLRTPLAMMSQMVAGTIASTLIVTLPGSTNGVKESLEAILPAVFHARKMLKSKGH